MRRLLVSALCGVMLGLAGCRGVNVQLASTPTPAPTDHGGTGGAGIPAGPVTATGSGTLRLLVEPAAGLSTMYKLITGAKSSVDLTMYELKDPVAERDLAADAARGVDVRVILDRHLEQKSNQATYDYLSAHRVHVTWAPKGTTYHQKTLTVDNKTSIIMTLNWVTEDYASTRDFAVVDTDRTDVAAIVATFSADFAHHAITPPDGADLVWSPTNAQASILAVIDSARHTLAVENEEMNDSVITSALISAARRGVDVTVVMTADSEWDRSFDELVAAGVHVRTYKNSSRVLYIHAKAVVADAGRSGEQVFTGSENFSTASLRYNRELGIRTSNKSVIAGISATIAADYAGATPYSGG
jgi:cardiolipin synthase A/B